MGKGEKKNELSADARFQASLMSSSAKQGDAELPNITQDQYRANAKEVVATSRMGHQIAVVDAKGAVRSIIGLNGVRALPRRPLDPSIVEILQSNECPPSNQGTPWVT